MSAVASVLGIGDQVGWQGDRWQVEAYLPSGEVRLRLLGGQGGLSLVDHRVLLAELTSPIGDAAPTSGPSRFALDLDGLAPAAAKKIKQLHLDLCEVRFGFRTPEAFATQTARAGYEPELTNEAERLELKAVQLGVSLRTMQRRYTRWVEQGPVGLVDRRSLKSVEPLSASAAYVVSVIQDVAREHVEKSTMSKGLLRAKVTIAIRKDPEGAAAAGVDGVPPERTFNRLVDRALAGERTFGAAKHRRMSANRPAWPYNRGTAGFPGELVLIDSTPLDVHCWDLGGSWARVGLVAAIDLNTRGVVAWRIVPVTERGLDAVLLLGDMIRPREGSNVICVGRPSEISLPVDVDADGEDPSGGEGGLAPVQVVIDRGRVYTSEAFQSACVRLGISVIFCRPRTPTDKALSSHCTSCCRFGQVSAGEASSHALDEAGVAGFGRFEELFVLVVGLVADEEADGVPGVCRNNGVTAVAVTGCGWG